MSLKESIQARPDGMDPFHWPDLRQAFPGNAWRYFASGEAIFGEEICKWYDQVW